MHLKNLLVFLCLLGLLSSNLSSADFLVLSMFGEITKRETSESKWTRIKTASELTISDEIRLTEKSYICLYHESGNSIEFNKPGTYKLKSYSDILNKKAKPVLDIIGQFMFKQIFEADNNIIKDPKTGTMTISVGGVERGLDVLDKNKPDSKMKRITVKSPRHYFTLDNYAEFRWYPIKNNLNYNLFIVDSNNDTILKRSTSDSILKLDLSEMMLEKGICYFWSLSSDSYKSDNYCLYLFSDEEKEEIINEILEIESHFGEDSSPIKEMSLAVYYFLKKIDNRAIKHFENAIQLAPGSIEYRKIYALYLAKSGYYDEASEVLNRKN